MKQSKRNLTNAQRKAEKRASGPPPLSKYAAKVRKQYVDQPQQGSN